MKKNLLTFLFVVVFLCGGTLTASAKTSSASGNSVAVSARISPAKTISNKIKVLKAKCGQMQQCAAQLDWLLQMNQLYELDCASGGYRAGCSPGAERDLMRAADIYELCLWWNGYW